MEVPASVESHSSESELIGIAYDLRNGRYRARHFCTDINYKIGRSDDPTLAADAFEQALGGQDVGLTREGNEFKPRRRDVDWWFT